MRMGISPYWSQVSSKHSDEGLICRERRRLSAGMHTADVQSLDLVRLHQVGIQIGPR
jgi:hypothetical protein